MLQSSHQLSVPFWTLSSSSMSFSSLRRQNCKQQRSHKVLWHFPQGDAGSSPAIIPYFHYHLVLPACSGPCSHHTPLILLWGCPGPGRQQQTLWVQVFFLSLEPPALVCFQSTDKVKAGENIGFTGQHHPGGKSSQSFS